MSMHALTSIHPRHVHASRVHVLIHVHVRLRQACTTEPLVAYDVCMFPPTRAQQAKQPSPYGAPPIPLHPVK